MSDYEIKMEGEFHTFDGGAIRYTKEGKGRPDLIPPKTLYKLISKIEACCDKGTITDGSMSVVFACVNEGKWLDTIIELFTAFYIRPDLDYGYESCPVMTRESHIPKMAEMLLDLAIHFEKGAEKYGEHNCERGIPLESFVQSGMRHTLQAFAGKTDENHVISAIWNFFMAEFTVSEFDQTNIQEENKCECTQEGTW